MAKKKTEKASPFVPVEEQPYQVPENWCWIRLLSAFDNKTDSKKKLPQKEYAENGEIPIVDQGKELIGGYTDKVELSYGGDLPVIVFGDHTRCVKFVDFDFVQGADGIKVLVPQKYWDRKAFYYAFQSIDIPNMGYRRHYPLFGQFSLPLPPIAEQQRIVARIESLFGKLDEAKEKAQEALDSFETRKAAVLHRAFLGELTEGWRKAHDISFDAWKTVCWGDLITSIEAGKNWKAEGRPPERNEFGVVKVSSVTWGEFNELESKTCTSENQWNKNVQIHEGDFLFSRANTLQLVGNCVIAKNVSRRLMLSDKILRLTFSGAAVPEYILYFTRSDLYRQQIEQLASGNQDGMRNVSQKNMKLIEFPVALLSEQTEIVRILDTFFEQEAQAKAQVETTLEAIDTMKKSILSKAFRGELGTNNPVDESAEELLKRTLA